MGRPGDEDEDGTAEPSLIEPPRLRTGEKRSASNLELFFDISFLLFVRELSLGVDDDLGWRALVEFGGLFVVVWFSWLGFTLYANRFDTDDVVYRAGKLLAMLGIVGCAASADGATGSFVVAFTLSYILGRVVLVGLYARAWRHVVEARPTVLVYLFGAAATVVLWTASLAVPAPAKYLLWAASILVDAAGPVVATRQDSTVPLHIVHLVERFGLLVILVLGEVVAGLVTAVHEAAWEAESVRLGLIGFAVTAALWWNYFDVGATVAGRALVKADDEDDSQGMTPGHHDDTEPGDRQDLFIYGHLPLTMGIGGVGVALENLVLHPGQPQPSSAGWLLCGGLATFFAGAAVIVGGARERWRDVLVWPVGALPLLFLLGWFGLGGNQSWLAVVATVTIAMAVAGSLLRRRYTPVPDAGETAGRG